MGFRLVFSTDSPRSAKASPTPPLMIRVNVNACKIVFPSANFFGGTSLAVQSEKDAPDDFTVKQNGIIPIALIQSAKNIFRPSEKWTSRIMELLI